MQRSARITRRRRPVDDRQRHRSGGWKPKGLAPIAVDKEEPDYRNRDAVGGVPEQVAA